MLNENDSRLLSLELNSCLELFINVSTLCVITIHTQCRRTCISCTSGWVWFLAALADQAEVPFRSSTHSWEIWSTCTSEHVLLGLCPFCVPSPLQWGKAPSRHTVSSLPCSSSDSMCLLCPSAALSGLASGACLPVVPCLGCLRDFRMPSPVSGWCRQFSPPSAAALLQELTFQACPLPQSLTLIIQSVNLLPGRVQVVSELINLHPWLWQRWNFCSWPILGVWE